MVRVRTMQYVGRHTFAAPIDRVWGMFRDQGSHLAKFEAMGPRDIELLEYDADADRVHVGVKRIVDTELPGFAKKVLKPTNTVTTTDEWKATGDGSYAGRYVVDTGTPVKIAGTTSLRPDGDRTAYEITVDVDVKVPLIGGKIADFAKGDVARQLDMEFTAGDDWLASH